MPDTSQGALDSQNPSAVDLTRLRTRLSSQSGEEALYRSIVQRVALSEGSEFVLVPSGRGRGAEFVAESTGAAGAGADPDPVMVSAATDRAREAGLAGRLHFEQAPLEELPYQDAVFDVALGELELGAAPDPDAAVRELARVTKPGGTVALVLLTWLRALSEDRKRELAEQLGVRPRMLGEWLEALREAGLVDLQVEDGSAPTPSQSRPSFLEELAEVSTLRGKLLLLPRAWRRWGWQGVKALLAREGELRRVLEDEQVLGVSLVTGTRRGVSTMEADGEEHDK